jgi:hypothetical protein
MRPSTYRSFQPMIIGGRLLCMSDSQVWNDLLVARSKRDRSRFWRVFRSWVFCLIGVLMFLWWLHIVETRQWF